MTAAAPRYRLTLFQCWTLTDGGSRIHLAQREQRLVAALAISGPGPRHYLAGLLWPESPESLASESLRVTLHRTTRQLPGLVSVGRSTLALAPEVEVDLHRVRAVVAALSSGTQDGYPADTIGQLGGAELLPGWNDEWILGEQWHLRLQRVAALERLAAGWLRRGDQWLALEAAAAALELEPLRESAVVAMAQAHLQTGNRAMALDLLLTFEARLRGELGVGASPRLAALIRLITITPRTDAPYRRPVQAAIPGRWHRMVFATERRGRPPHPASAGIFRLPRSAEGGQT